MQLKHRFFILAIVLSIGWIGMTYFLFLNKPLQENKSFNHETHNNPFDEMKAKLSKLQNDIHQQSDSNNALLDEVKALKNDVVNKVQGIHTKSIAETIKKHEDIENEVVLDKKLSKEDVIPVLMFSCNRPTVKKALDSLLRYQPNSEKFPLIVSQDCGHVETKSVILSYGDKVKLIENPHQGQIDIPIKEKKFSGYFKIARHYGWALNYVFNEMGHNQVIVVEDDLEFSPDFFSYFEATLPILRKDKSLMCVSAWNDNGKTNLIDESHPELLYRTDFFGGLGWMLTKDFWQEIGPKWPKSYWDDWIREPAQRKQRSCIRPEISRTKTFGKIGVSNGLFFDKHLKFIKLNSMNVDFNQIDLGYLEKENYDKEMKNQLNNLPVVNIEDLKNRNVNSNTVRIMYHNKLAFKKYAKVLGIMDDFKSGVPRMAYKGIVSTMYQGIRVYVTPNLNWKGYDPTWS